MLAGKIEVFGKECTSEANFVTLRGSVGLLFQDSDDQLFCPTVLEDVAFGPLNQGHTPRDAQDLARETMARLWI